MEIIQIENLTKDYEEGKGIFDINLSVNKGEIHGFLGPNGAGKTTTIRHLMGFTKPDGGQCRINGKNCFSRRGSIQKTLGYLPGEVNIMDEMTGEQFIEFMRKMKKVKDRDKIDHLVEYFELDLSGKIKKMSKGTKQKLGIVCAFMNSPEVLLLDEPTSGLDPLMQNKFINLILEEKKKGTTIFLSSHIFEEIERACDRVTFIRNGKLILTKDMDEIKKSKRRVFSITFANSDDEVDFLRKNAHARKVHEHVDIDVIGEVDPLIKGLFEYKILDLQIKVPTLEEIFLHYYEKRRGR